MNDTITRWLAGIGAQRDRSSIAAVVNPIADRVSTQGLSISTIVANTATAKTGAADSYFLVKGRLVLVAAATTGGALVGNIALSKINVYCFFVDGAGVITNAMGTEATLIGDVLFPPFPQGKALVGYLIITYASAFTGGTTPLDTATTVYVSPVGPFDPSVLV